MPIDPVKEYMDAAAKFLAATKGIPEHEALSKIKDLISGDNRLPTIKNPRVVYLGKNDVNDREVRECSLYNYIKKASSKERIIVPSFTSYVHNEIEESDHSGLLTVNIAIRSEAKKKAIQARSEGQTDVYVYQNTFQKAKKLTNNALSGTYGSEGTALYNPSAHYTLTSMTRCVSSIGNAYTEKMVGGNRHYRHPDIIFNDVATLATDVDMDALRRLIDKYDLVTPTPHDCLRVAKFSFSKYWLSSRQESDLLDLFCSLPPVHRAAFVYVNDLKHFSVFNPDLTHEIIDQLSTKVAGGNDSVEPGDMYKIDDMCVILAHHVCKSDIAGLGTNYHKFKANGVLGDVYATAKHIESVFRKYYDLLATLFYNNHMPISTAYIYSMLREVTVLSDTDSTCATYQDWVTWHQGELSFTDKAVGVSAAVMIINSKGIRHYLKLFSERMNVDKKNIDVLDMKNEFYWTIMTPTNVTKHYYAGVMIQEGSVFRDIELELKGAHLIASKTIPWVSDGVKEDIMELMRTIMRGDKISLNAFIQKIVGFEQQIIAAVKKGDPSVFMSEDIKDADSYKQSDEESRFRYHLLWKNVFEPKYGHVDDPPYRVVKIPMTINNKTAIASWLDSISDPGMKQRLIKYFETKKTPSFTTMLVSRDHIESKGIPEELLSVIDYRRMVSEALKPYYLVLETLGYYVREGMILSDHFPVQEP